LQVDRFTKTLKPHLDDALNYCRALCSGRAVDDADDILQIALTRAFRAFDSLEKPGSFKPWFFRIITNTFYTQTRSYFWKRHSSLDELENMDSFPHIYSETNDLNLSMQDALSRLSKKERVAILLFEVGGFSVKEIADFQGEKSPSAIKSRLSRTRAKMKKYLTESLNSSSDRRVLTSKQTMGDLQYETISLAEKINIKK